MRIGVVGAGTMGSGIAQTAAEAGFDVILQDVEESFVQRGLENIQKNLEKAVQKGKKSTEEKDKTLSMLTATTKLEDFYRVDLVLEAIFEDMEAKKELYKKLDNICPDKVCFASNTSGLSITEIAASTSRPEKVIGMHFFNPVPVMKLVEVVKGAKTSEETYSFTMDLARKMGKDPITVNEAPLFAVNRILCPMLNEAIFAYMEGVASKEDIDKGMVLGANHPIGPLALSDLVGLDVLLHVLDTMFQETLDSKYRAAPLLRKMVRAGTLGRKTGEGFYHYN